jgi:hypothetical protein
VTFRSSPHITGSLQTPYTVLVLSDQSMYTGLFIYSKEQEKHCEVLISAEIAGGLEKWTARKLLVIT